MRHPKLLAVLLLLSVIGSVKAQSIPWDTDIVSGTAPIACSDGSPLSMCPISGYRVQVASSATGTFTDVLGDVTTPLKTLTAVAAGNHCYRFIVLSANGNSVPSDAACTVTVRPTPAPGPVTGIKVDSPTAFYVRPNLQRFVFERGPKYEGFVKVGAACDADRSVGDGYYVISRLTQVTPRPPAGTVLVARCT